MTFKPPVDFKEMMQMFDPERISKMFNPEQMMAAFKGKSDQPFDVESLIASNQKNFEAMVAANKAAAAGYQEFYSKQMAIFTEVTNSAQEQLKAGTLGGGENPAEVYQKAVEKALALMADFASAAQKAQKEAGSLIDAQVKQAVAGFKSS
jgi:hypothetical protein